MGRLVSVGVKMQEQELEIAILLLMSQGRYCTFPRLDGIVDWVRKGVRWVQSHGRRRRRVCLLIICQWDWMKRTCWTGLAGSTIGRLRKYVELEAASGDGVFLENGPYQREVKSFNQIEAY